VESRKDMSNNSPKPSFLSRLMLFSAPVALACLLAQASWSNASEEVMGNEGALSCALESGEMAGMQDQANLGYFDTSWLPSRGDFERVSNNQPEETLWNPLGKSWLSAEQLVLLGMAYNIGYQDGGKTHAKLVQAVLLQETIAGQLGRLGHLSAPLGKRSYGVMQVKVVAARDVLHQRPQLGYFRTDDQLITRLITDDEFNIRVASAYLKMLRSHARSDHKALVAYNIGMNAARRVTDAGDFKYVRKVERYLAVVVRRYNTKFSSAEAVHIASM
jgi:hypothetical protein